VACICSLAVLESHLPPLQHLLVLLLLVVVAVLLLPLPLLLVVVLLVVVVGQVAFQQRSKGSPW
jgi:energy-coupling factor transporter transmembrane protein EcfT